MSHIVTVKTQIKDAAALVVACSRLGLSPPVQGKAQLYAGEQSGLLVNLPGWQYPIVADTTSGTLAYDNFNEAWGKQSELDRLLQAYAVEKAKIEARKAGHSTSEQVLADGSIKLTIHAGGGA